MKRLTSALIVLQISMLGALHAQKLQGHTDPPKSQRVTLELERYDDTKGKVWLRLRNSTAWDIRIPVETAFPGEKVTGDVMKSARTHKDGAEAPVRYYLEEFPTNNPEANSKLPAVPRLHRYDFLTEWWIPKNQSIVFQVPKEHLAMNAMLSVTLRYEWEDLRVETLDGPVHLVYFRGIDLPDDVQLKVNDKFWKDWTASKP